MLRGRLAALALAATLTFAACGGDSDPFPDVVTLGEGEIFPSILNSSLAVGENRFVLRLDDVNEERVLGAAVRLRFYDLDESDDEVAFETDARFVPIELGYVDELSDGARETTGNDGVYVAQVSFAHAGDWGVKVRATVGDDELDEAPFRFNVLEHTVEPAFGDEAPRSRQATTADGSSIEEIDSSFPPRPGMHDLTIAEAIASTGPIVVAFAPPAYCPSRLCAPVMDTVMDPLAAKYAGRAHFIHVEPYVLRDLRTGFIFTETPVLREWRLPSEPWIFVIDREGRISAKFEGVISLDEVEAALVAAIG